MHLHKYLSFFISSFDNINIPDIKMFVKSLDIFFISGILIARRQKRGIENENSIL